MKCTVVVGLICAMAWSVFGCSSRDTSTVSGPVGVREATEVLSEQEVRTGRIAFHVRYLYPSGKVAKSAVVDTMRAYVYEPDGRKITQADLEKVGDRGKASIAVAAGTDRRVDLVAYDGSLVSWLGSDTDVDVVAGQTTTAEITMERFAPALGELASPDMDGSYTVTWSGVEEVTGYTVQESGDVTFSSPRVIYTGTDMTTVIEKTTDGTYWYRVKATGKYGEGMWCSVGSVEVAILGVPELETVSSPDTDGTYTVSWSAGAHGEQYVVEEDDNEGFSSPTEVYEGTALSVDRTEMAQGTYWYRVKATNAYGESGWSHAVWVEVVSEGAIDIDVPWPTDGGAIVDLVAEEVFLTLPDAIEPIDPESLRVGDKVDLNVRVRNTSSVAITGWRSETYIDGTRYSSGENHSIDPNATTIVYVGWTVVSGTHTVEFRLDTGDVVRESNEANNTARLTFTVPPEGGTIAGKSVEGVEIGFTKAQVTAKLGPPDTVDESGNFIYGSLGIGVLFRSDQAYMILVLGPYSGSTGRGIRIGSPISDVVAQYGTDYMDEPVGDRTTYWYGGIGIAFTFDEGDRVYAITIFAPSAGSIIAGKSVQGVEIGFTKNQVIATLGQPGRIDEDGDFFYASLVVIFAEDRVSMIMVYSGMTEKGIGIGAPTSDVVAKYGTGYYEDQVGQRTAYFYFSLGIAFVFDEGYVYYIVIFPPASAKVASAKVAWGHTDIMEKLRMYASDVDPKIELIHTDGVQRIHEAKGSSVVERLSSFLERWPVR